MLLAYRRLVKRRQMRKLIVSVIDGFFTLIGMMLMVCFMIIILPILIIDQWMSGE